MEVRGRWKGRVKGTGARTPGLFLGTLVALLLWQTVVGTGEGKFGYFSQTNNSSVVLRHTTWNVQDSGQTEFSFRTCSNGELLFQQGAGGDFLKLLILNGTLEFHWSISQTSDKIFIGDGLNNNDWYTVSSHKYLGKLFLNVSKAGNVLFSEEVSNSTYRTYFQNLNLTGNVGLQVGRGFTGCLMEGPNVIFLNNAFIEWSTGSVEWSNVSCPRSDNSCIVADGDIDDCYSHPCMYGGTCIDGLYNYTCQCPHLYNGTNCENDLSDYGCDVEPCLNGGTCEQTTGTPKPYKCHCVLGYTGYNCENDINECGPNPCQNDVQCIDLIGAYQCNCSGSGYTGNLCERDIDECEEDHGLCNGGTCHNNPGSFSCTCPEGYFGTHCEEINECSSNPCQNNGTCEDLVNDFNCTCSTGYQGRMCETDIDDCAAQSVSCPGSFTKCYDLVNDYKCDCLAGYRVIGSGPDCEEINECIPNPCIHGTCEDLVDAYRCNCSPGYTGQNCQDEINECQPDPCIHGNCTDLLNGYTCSCEPGYTGQNCSVNINECVLTQEPCKNGGHCVDGVNGFTCDCAVGYTGAICDVDINECDPNPCIYSISNGCTDLIGNFSCSCLLGYTGQRCEIDIDDCASAPCKNNGTCTDLVNGYNCTCADEWMGETCEIVYNACSPALQNCKNGATCMTTIPSREFNCTCVSGFTGNDCGENINDCHPDSCQSYERCYDEINGFHCACPPGFTGSNCDTEIDECASNPCQNNATCRDLHADYSCSCKYKVEKVPDGSNRTFETGYKGKNCEIDIDECAVRPTICLNVAQCTNNNGSFKCYCGSDSQGNYFTGSHCEVSSSYCTLSEVARLDPPACHNGGTCYGQKKNFTCSCAPGFTGWRCKTNIDECESNPCQYNGTCIDGINGYNCSCIPGIMGDNCEININDCDPNPCGPGRCNDLINDYECDCTDTGFKGENCSINIDDCESTPCLHNATCEDKIKNFGCLCYPGYDGKQCDNDINECNSNPCRYGNIISGTCYQRSIEAYYNNGTKGFENLTFSYETAAGYVCNCIPGITGASCEINIDDCNHDNCNNGTCIDGINEYTCECFPGYEGEYCAVEINECLRFMPCKNGARCTDLIADYSCQCLEAAVGQPQYAGKNCSFELTSCESNLCQNGATCQPYLIDEATAQEDYRCLCTNGFTGHYCNISTTMSFDTGSYIKQDVTDVSNVSLSFRFRTTLKNSILLSWGGSHDTGLFLTLELKEGNLLLHFYDVFVPGRETRDITGASTFSDAEWHTVHFSKSLSEIQVKVTSSNCVSDTLCTVDTNFESYANDSATTDIRFGMVTEMSLNHTQSLTPFVGCMEDVSLFGTKLVLTDDSQNFFHISSGCPRVEQCVPDPCNSRGTCMDLWNKHKCDCRRPFLGSACETGYVAATFGYNFQDSSATFVLPPSLKEAVKNRFDLSFFIRTRQPNGLVLFFGDLQTSFISLELDHGHLGIRTKFCGGPGEYRRTLGGSYADGVQYFIHLERNTNEFKFIQGSSQFSETVPANCMFSANNLMFGGITPSQLGRRRRDIVSVPGKDVTDFTDATKFKGTVQDARVNGISLEFYPLPDATLSNLPTLAVTTQTGVEENEKTSLMCDLLTPCENNSTCHDVFFDDYRCDCTLGYRGKNCSELDFCVIGTCPDGSTCQSLQDGFECISSATFDGKTTAVSYTHTILNTSTIRTFSLEFRTLSMNGWIMHIGNGNQYYKVRLTGSHVVVLYKLGSGLEKQVEVASDISDSKWYMASVSETDDSVTLTLTEVGNEAVIASTTGSKDSGSQLTEMLKSVRTQIVIGNLGVYDSRDPYYHGCLKEVRIGKILLPFFNDDLFVNNTSTERFLLHSQRSLKRGCEAGNMCSYSQCRHGSDCIPDFYDYQCNCSAAYSGKWCQDQADYCSPNLCSNGQCVSVMDNFECQCPSGYSGDRCETDIDECTATPDLCQNNGVCQNFNGTYNCSCTDLFGGENCDIALNNTCLDNPCVNGQCSSVNITLTGTGEEIESFKCDCDSGYQGYICDSQINYCSSFPCDNGGTCTPVLGSFSCSCPNGYTGNTCSENIDDCPQNNCLNGGQCIDGLNTYTCNCTEFWQGAFCTEDVDECTQRQPCENRGLCRNHDNGYTCNCAGTGFEGQNCDQDIDECKDPNTCLNGASCNNTRGSFDCDCTIGYQGVNCQTPNCSQVPCIHSSTCAVVEAGTKWKCQCLSEFYEGDYCEVKGPCAYDPCNSQNTQSCSQNTTENTYTCNCRPGWQGENCTEDIDECDALPCKNNATCVNTQGSFQCACDTGYEGPLCGVITDNCNPSPCKNGGLCTNFIGYFECNCSTTGYTNETCVDDVDECIEIEPCLHGTCQNTVGDYNCECESGYEGKDCEIRVDSLMDEPIVWYIVGPCVAVVLILIVIAVVWVLLCLRKKRATRGAYSPSRQEVTGSRVELDNVLKKPPLERLI